MLLYGSNLNEIVNFDNAYDMLNLLPDSFDNLTKFELVQQIKAMIQQTKDRKDENHSKYVIVLKNNYDWDKTDDDFVVGDEVAYYIGDLPRTNKNLHRRFIGPCKILERLKNEETGEPISVVHILILGTERELTCHTCMLKRYNKNEFTPIAELQTSIKAALEIELKQKQKQFQLKMKRAREAKEKSKASKKISNQLNKTTVNNNN